MSIVASAAIGTLAAAEPSWRRRLNSSGVYAPPDPCTIHTRPMRGSSAAAIVTNGAPRLTPTASMRSRSTSGNVTR
jgi:hypothetical protein